MYILTLYQYPVNLYRKQVRLRAFLRCGRRPLKARFAGELPFRGAFRLLLQGESDPESHILLF